jgi:hypothetical protein
MIIQRLSKGIKNQDWFVVMVEVMIVVVGIFIGLQVDDWNEERKQRQQEQEYLIALNQDITTSKLILAEHKVFIEERLGYLKVLMKPETASNSEIDNDQMELMVWRGIFWINLLERSMSVYEELKSSGQLATIQDSELRRMLSRLDLLLNRTSDKEAFTVDFQMKDIGPYMQPLLNLKLIYRQKADWDILPESWRSLKETNDWQAFLGDPEVQDLIAGLYLELAIN